MSLGNPYYYHPHPAARLAADDVLLHLSKHPVWHHLFEQGKMLGVLVVNLASADAEKQNDAILSRVHYLDNIAYLVAYSGVINGLCDTDGFFVPPVYDLQQPDDFYLQRDAAITQLNSQLAELEATKTNSKLEEKNLSRQICNLKAQRKELSIALQREIFSHFNFINHQGRYRNIIDIFSDAKRGLPPGGAGECAAPRLLQYAYENELEPVAVAEFWAGRSPARFLRIHGHFYPSCIEKCSPILSFMNAPLHTSLPDTLPAIPQPIIVYQDSSLLVVFKPKGLLSTPAKDLTQPNLEDLLHHLYPMVKGPMLAHRLDQATSGLMLAAKDSATYKALQQQFEGKTIHKRYLATVRGYLHSRYGIITLPITVNPDDRPRQVVDWQFGKAAITYYEVLSAHTEYSTLALYPLTGRTHQLRVHCASPFGLDAPILGDRLYDIMKPETSMQEKNKCLQLHAESITFTHPVTGQSMSFSYEL